MESTGRFRIGIRVGVHIMLPHRSLSLLRNTESILYIKKVVDFIHLQYLLVSFGLIIYVVERWRGVTALLAAESAPLQPDWSRSKHRNCAPL